MTSQDKISKVLVFSPHDMVFLFPEIVSLCRGQQGHSNHQSALGYRDLWWWLIYHDVPRNEIDEQCRRVLLDIYNRKTSSGCQKFDLSCYNGEQGPLTKFPDRS